MNKQDAISRSCIFAGALAALLWLTPTQTATAGNATWKVTPTSGDWNNAANWLGSGPPNGPGDVATFYDSSVSDIVLSAPTTVNTMLFYHRPNQANYTFTAPYGTQLLFVGAGVSNDAGVELSFVAEAGGGLVFLNSSTPQNSYGATFTNRGGTASELTGGFVEFLDNSQANKDLGIPFENEGGTVAGASGGLIEFRDNATSNGATFTNYPGVVGAGGGVVNFFDSSTGFASVFNNSGADVAGGGAGSLHLYGSANIEGCELFANAGSNGGDGGLIEYNDDSTGAGTVYVYGNAVLDLARHNPVTPVSISILRGDGLVSLGATNLRIGTSFGSVYYRFSGTISDGGAGGSVTIVGSNVMLFDGASTYTGGTTVLGGYLEVLSNPNGSGTGPGPVVVPAGTLGGDGVIGGEVTLGDGRARRAILSPSDDFGGLGELKIQRRVTFKSDATYRFELRSDTGAADRLDAKGVSINSGAVFTFTDLGNGTLPSGTVYMVINNTGQGPISGKFSNLLNGSIFTVHGNTYQVNYSGGDGNDLTLTVQ